MFRNVYINGLKILCFLLLLVIMSTSAILADTTITFLHTNDIHAWLTPEKNTKYGKNLGGVARIYEFATKVKKDNPNVLLLHAGDLFQGTPYYGTFHGEACLKVLEAAGYDATTLGNHEYDNGLPNIINQLSKVRLDLLCCNVFYKKSGNLVFTPYKIVFRGGKKIAIIGSIGDSAWMDIGKNVKKTSFEKNQIKTVKKLSDMLRPSVDLVILLSHGGVRSDKRLAAEVNSVDLIIGGHSHTFLFKPIFIKNKVKNKLANSLDGTIIVQTGKHGLFVGKVDITLNEFNEISTYTYHLEKMDERYDPKEGNPVVKVLAKYKKQLDKTMNKVIAKADFDLTFTRALKNKTFSTAGNFATEAMNKGIGSDICITNAGSIRSSLTKGDISLGQIYTVLPFDNNLFIFKMKGKDIQTMLNLMCSFYGRGPWFQCAGVSATFDLKKNKALDVKVGGKPLDPEKVYTVSTSSFVAEGNLKGDVLFKNALGIKDSGIFMRDAAINYLKKLKKPLGAFKSNGIELINKPRK